jgi:hypothetical protein
MGKKSTPSPGAEQPPTILHSPETAKSWSDWPADRKLHMIARETADRLDGMASVLFGMGLWREHIRPECSFLGGSLQDLALGLQRACAAQWAEWEAAEAAEDARTAARKRKASRKPAKRAREAANGAEAQKPAA